MYVDGNVTWNNIIILSKFSWITTFGVDTSEVNKECTEFYFRVDYSKENIFWLLNWPIRYLKKTMKMWSAKTLFDSTFIINIRLYSEFIPLTIMLFCTDIQLDYDAVSNQANLLVKIMEWKAQVTLKMMHQFEYLNKRQ